MKKCKSCNKDLSIECYRSVLDKRDGRTYYRTSCRECENEKYNSKEKASKYYQQNKEEIKNRVKQYRQNNKDLRNKNERLKKKNDNLYRVKCRLRTAVCQSFQYVGKKKNTKTEKILGLAYADFKKYIESQFEDWMNWENYGKYNGDFNYGWDLDHIIPLSSAKTEQEIIKLNHYTNIQPLCSKVNRDIKKDKVSYE